MTNETEIKPIQTWAILELMGHVKTAGQVSEETHFGTVLGRIDVPEVGDKPAHTFYFGGESIFRLTPCDEQVARLVLQQSFQAPIVAYQLPRPKFGQAELFGEEGPGQDYEAMEELTMTKVVIAPVLPRLAGSCDT